MGKITLVASIVAFWGIIIIAILYPFIIKPLLRLYKAKIDSTTDKLEQEKYRQMLEEQYRQDNTNEQT